MTIFRGLTVEAKIKLSCFSLVSLRISLESTVINLTSKMDVYVKFS